MYVRATYIENYAEAVACGNFAGCREAQGAGRARGAQRKEHHEGVRGKAAQEFTDL